MTEKKPRLNDTLLRVVWHANDMLWLWKQLADGDVEGRGWYKQGERQAYQDSLQSLKSAGLIESYDVVKIQVKIAGHWYSDRKPYNFVQTGPEIDVN